MASPTTAGLPGARRRWSMASTTPRRPRGSLHRGRDRPGHVPGGSLRQAGAGAASFLTVAVWRDQAEHAIESLSKGSRVVVVGRLQQRTWAAEDDSARSVVEVVAEELGPSLRWATATMTRTTRSQDRASSISDTAVGRGRSMLAFRSVSIQGQGPMPSRDTHLGPGGGSELGRALLRSGR
jgi:Single-strand binding protein family